MGTSPGVRLAGAAAAIALALGGCAAGDGEADGSMNPPPPSSQAFSAPAGHSHAMDGGPAPEGIQTANNARFPLGARVVLEADHMPGMQNAPATIAGAFRSTAYSVDYTPTDGAPAVKDHKWIVQEEVQDASDRPLDIGDTAVMTATHMPGMEGANATISKVWTGTVYMVDYQADGMTMKNHKWVVEDEIRPAR